MLSTNVSIEVYWMLESLVYSYSISYY